MSNKRIRSALISVFHKTGLAPIVKKLDQLDVSIYSTGGTQKYIENLGIKVEAVEDLTTYPSILDGRVKTLHPKVFGGILARREADHLRQLAAYKIPELDLVIVDLYPFEATLANTTAEAAIIEKIDIGGISLIRAAAKNYRDVVIVPSQAEYDFLQEMLEEKNGHSDLEDRKYLAAKAFGVSAHYDAAIYQYYTQEAETADLRISLNGQQTLRYGENPHQKGNFYGDFEAIFDKLSGKAISYNNLVDIDAAVSLMREFKDTIPTFAVLKHTNACGIASRTTVFGAWKAALAGDPISAFGGILISNTKIDLATAESINQLFYEVLIAPDFDADALELLQRKKKRILLKLKIYPTSEKTYKSLLNGVIMHDTDLKIEVESDLKVVTKIVPSDTQIQDLLFANKVAKHLKSNTIVLAKDQQLLGMGCGQTSRVDALKQAILKAKHFEFSLEGAVMASDAFFPFPDCVEIADQAGIKAVIQPGGSIKDQLSIDYCNEHDLSMVMTGIRHFRH
ncbi:MAG: bifunctional phosphoribosylaminoimidazolecarboxamide formyltransferase/IMP cyclohydrolase [Bacteroidota bacterium]